MELKDYLKYYWLENYLFEEVQRNFQKSGHLKPEEFFAIIIWKRAASKTKIKDSLIDLLDEGKTVESITADVFKNKNHRLKQLNLLTDINQIGVSIASAILTVCYPDDFTIVDVRACASLQRPPFNVEGFPYEKFLLKDESTKKLYLEYVDTCKALAAKKGLRLRDFDRVLFGMDLWDEPKTGLSHLIDEYQDERKVKGL
jgi:hypothetical protein